MTDHTEEPSANRPLDGLDGLHVDGNRPWTPPSAPTVHANDIPSGHPSTDRAGRPTAGSDPYADDPELRRAAGRAYRLGKAYCIAAVAGSLSGQITGAQEQWGLALWQACLVVGVLDLGGITVLHLADVRRRLGETAALLMAASVGVAAVATSVNYSSHTGALRYVFAAISVLAYLVYVALTEFKRRDRQRLLGHGKPVIPTYELVGHYLTHPWLTARARSLAKRTIEAGGQIGRYESFEMARAAAQLDRRNRVLTRRLRRNLGKAGALADSVYDSDVIAARMRAKADNGAVADRLMDELGIDRIAVAANRPPVRKPSTRPPTEPSVDAVQPSTVHDDDRPTEPSAPSVRRSRPPSTKPPGRRPSGPSDGLHLVWSPTVRRNAAALREAYPDGLPTKADGSVSVRRIRDELRWTNDKASPAVRAYEAKADLDDDSERVA